MQQGYIEWQTQAAQERDDHGTIRDRRYDPGPRAATGAGEHIQGKDAAHQLGPGQLAARFCARPGFGWRCSRRSATRHDVWPQTRVGGKDTVVTHQVCPGTRDERGQLLDELRRLEQEVGRAIREGAAQLVAHLAIALHLKAVMRKRWAQHVATDALALVGVVWGYIEIGVQTEALGSSAARARVLDPRYRPQRAQPLYAAARPLPQRDAT